MNQKQKNIIERKTKDSIRTGNRKRLIKQPVAGRYFRTLWCQFYESFQTAKIILF